jgi:tetratricopeptide (TPR) repeat protein
LNYNAAALAILEELLNQLSRNPLLTQNQLPDSSIIWQQYSQAQNIRKDLAGLHHLAGKAYNNLKEPQKALPFLEKAYDFSTENEEVLIDLALTYNQLNSPSDALFWLNECLNLNPLNPTAHYNLANIYLGQSQEEAGIRELKKCLQINRNYHQAHLTLAHIYSNQQNTDKEVEHFRLAAEITRDPELYRKLASVALNSDRLVEAIKYWQTLLQLKPDDYESKNNLVEAWLLTKNYDSALSIAKELVKAQPDLDNRLDLLDIKINLAQDEKSNFKDLQHLKKENPGSGRINYLLAVLNFQKGKRKKACKFLELAIRNGYQIEKISNNILSACR